MTRAVLLLLALAGCGSARAPAPASPRARAAQPPEPTSCLAGQFLDEASGGAQRLLPNGRVAATSSTTCQPFPAACASTPTCACMKTVGYDSCREDGGVVRVTELRP